MFEVDGTNLITGGRLIARRDAARESIVERVWRGPVEI